MLTWRRVALVVVLSWEWQQGAQSNASDRFVVADAVMFLRGAEVALKWHGEFRTARPADVIAFSRTGFVAPQGEAALRLRTPALGEADAILTPGSDWKCRDLPDNMYLRARCALVTSQFYVEVRGMRTDGDTALVTLSLFGHGSQPEPPPLNVVVKLAREGGRWKGVHIMRLVD